jgi:hypothetical protein
MSKTGDEETVNSINYYSLRSELHWSQMLLNAHRVDMVAITFNDLIVYNMGTITDAIKKAYSLQS